MDLTRTINFAAPVGSTAAEITAWEAARTTVEATLVAGSKYRFVVRALNHVGSSDASEELRVGLGGLPG